MPTVPGAPAPAATPAAPATPTATPKAAAIQSTNIVKPAAQAQPVNQATEASTEDLQDTIESDDASPEEQHQAAVELKKRMKFKINGKDVEREIDFGDENAIQELLQKGFASDERFQSASAMEKQMRQYAQMIQANPIEALRAAGHDPDKLTEEYMKRRVEELSKSPEQLKLEQLQRDLESERNARQQMENEKLTAEQQRVESEYSRQLDDEITTGLSSSELPKSPYVVKRIAEYLMQGINSGNEDITVADVLPIVEKNIKEEIRQMFEAMPEDVIERTLGTNVSKKLRNNRVKKAKAAPANTEVQATGRSETNKAKAEEEPTKKQKAKDFFGNW